MGGECEAERVDVAGDERKQDGLGSKAESDRDQRRMLIELVDLVLRCHDQDLHPAAIPVSELQVSARARPEVAARFSLPQHRLFSARTRARYFLDSNGSGAHDRAVEISGAMDGRRARLHNS